MSISNTKKNQIRKNYLNLRLKLSETEVNIRSVMITLKIQKIHVFLCAKSVLLYMPIKNEVETKYILSILAENKKNVLLPAYDKSGWCVSKYKIDDDLIFGPFNILQPKKIRITDISDCDIAIVPGIAFSESGVRVGYGKGVYDEMLMNSSCLKIGFCYDFQVVKSLKPKPNDVPMDIVISEKRIIRRQNSLFSNK